MREIVDRLLRVFAVARLSVIDDTGDQQKAQAQIASGAPDGVAEIVDGVPRVGEYGLAYCPPDGSEAIIIFLGGRRSNGVTIATGHRATRPKGLKPGEVRLYNGLSGAFVQMCQDGKCRSHGDWLHDGNFSATGDILDHSADGHGQTMRASRQVFDGHNHPVGSSTSGPPNQQEPS